MYDKPWDLENDAQTKRLADTCLEICVRPTVFFVWAPFLKSRGGFCLYVMKRMLFVWGESVEFLGFLVNLLNLFLKEEHPQGEKCDHQCFSCHLDFYSKRKMGDATNLPCSISQDCLQLMTLWHFRSHWERKIILGNCVTVYACSRCLTLANDIECHANVPWCLPTHTMNSTTVTWCFCSPAIIPGALPILEKHISKPSRSCG